MVGSDYRTAAENPGVRPQPQPPTGPPTATNRRQPPPPALHVVNAGALQQVDVHAVEALDLLGLVWEQSIAVGGHQGDGWGRIRVCAEGED